MDSAVRSTRLPAERGQAEPLLLELVHGLAVELGREPHEPIGLETSLSEELGIDSLGRLELLTRIQENFRIDLAQEQVLAADTPGELLAWLAKAPEPSRPRPFTDRVVGPATDRVVHSVADHLVSPFANAGTPTWPIAAETLTDVLRWHAEHTPSRTHLVILAGGSSRELSYGELLSQSETVALTLRSRGVSTGDSVALMLPTSEDYFASFFGILLAGGVPVPLYPPSHWEDPDQRIDQQASILSNAQAKVLILTRKTSAFVRQLQRRLPHPISLFTAEELLHGSEAHDVVASFNGVAELGLLQYTSGSTGDPKGVALGHAALLANIRAMGEVLQVTTDDVVVSWLPLYHDMGLIGAWLGSLYHGCRLVILSPQEFLVRPERWLWAIHEHRGTLSAAPNFAYEICTKRIHARDIAGLDLSSWRLGLNGAEPVSSGTLERFQGKFAASGLRAETLAPVYGLAESCVALTLPSRRRRPRIDAIRRATLQRESVAETVSEGASEEMRVVGCGSVIPGHQLRIVDANGRPLEDRREGRVQFRGPSATRGYHRNAEACARLFSGDWLDTGDLGYLVEGELFLTGRSKDLIIRAGRKFHPQELEEAIGRIESVHCGGVAVLGLTDEGRGTERIVVVAETRVRRTRSRVTVTTAIQTAVQPILGGFPDEIVLVPRGVLPKTSSGKLRRTECKARYSAGQLSANTRRSRARARGSRVGFRWLAIAVPRLRAARRVLTDAIHAAYGVWLISSWRSLCGGALLVIPGLARRRRFMAWACRCFLAAAGIRLSVEGRTHLAVGRSLVVANHQGLLSGIVMQALVPDSYFFTPKREFAEKPMAKLFLRRLGVQFVERRDPQAGLTDLELVRARLSDGESAVIFPEGTFLPEPGLRHFFMGGFVMAAETTTPIVPVAIAGARKIWRGKSWCPRLRPGAIKVRVMPPITPQGTDWHAAVRLRNEARCRILPHTGEFDTWGRS